MHSGQFRRCVELPNLESVWRKAVKISLLSPLAIHIDFLFGMQLEPLQTALKWISATSVPIAGRTFSSVPMQYEAKSGPSRLRKSSERMKVMLNVHEPSAVRIPQSDALSGQSRISAVKEDLGRAQVMKEIAALSALYLVTSTISVAMALTWIL